MHDMKGETPLNNPRLIKQIRFIIEIDRLKQVLRQNVVTGSDRNENDAEHSWHLAVMAVLLSEYSEDKSIDILKVIKMVLVHDIVEIDAGDTFCYDEKGYVDKEERERKAADRLFNILPSDQAQEMMELWREFEELDTPESRFAACMDRLQPLLLNYNTRGHTWQKHGVTSEKVFGRNALLEKNTPELWEYVSYVVRDSIRKGYLKENKE
jgi:putative hydrolase of HD superfamily